MDYLSYGDFANVKKRAGIFGTEEHSELVKMLREEQEAKEDSKNTRREPIGF
ncbi:hypothetical protein FACS189427_05200 [Planctomycetales bacterium]|nr:hypothetical protein FACS189427_05200 [Planctomycetales bacterium]